MCQTLVSQPILTTLFNAANFIPSGRPLENVKINRKMMNDDTENLTLIQMLIIMVSFIKYTWIITNLLFHKEIPTKPLIGDLNTNNNKYCNKNKEDKYHTN